MSDPVQEFREYREKMNKKILENDHRVMKRIFNLDTNTYMDGALPARIKETGQAKRLFRWAVVIL